ncbi:trypsin-like peptidase domain-containing protein [Pontibacter sp. KCTC 32443]|uniref:S1C family serine protease n=1 Tax=Pontibacter TaxID=323449 RepID=UPI00164D9612|nr:MULTISPECIES: trypsin-like peptidase domain-containing protein [Pontibacter]MBC5772773.1 trypsin-like peptidase domain-containing protein [Pontibacter sp. KCTC 32443]
MKLQTILLACLLISLSGCSGCSRSGKESKRRQLTAQSEGLIPAARPDRIKPERGARNTPVTEVNNTSGLSSLYEKSKKGVFLVLSTNDGQSGAQGSGFFISADGIGISNQHVFSGFHTHYIKMYDGTTYEVSKILRSSDANDLDYVLFKVNTQGDKVPFVPIARSLSAIGEDVFAIGNPKGLEHTLSTGIVSSYRDDNKLIQTTAEITNGSSGGPLFNMRGEVIGITTSGVGEANLNFAVNIQRLNLTSKSL